MNDRDQKVRPDEDAKNPTAPPDSQFGPSYREATDTEGWALRWDTTTPRRMALAKKMRGLRQASRKQ